jgi:hypothetical protein
MYLILVLYLKFHKFSFDNNIVFNILDVFNINIVFKIP